MYGWRFGLDPEMWGFMNRMMRDQRILTHENRHLVFDPTIELVHLDDWEIQRLWGLEPEETIKELKAMDIRYYLKVPNEKAHRINQRLGADDWLRLGLVTEVYKAGENILYRLH